jgi:hypothetical protein
LTAFSLVRGVLLAPDTAAAGVEGGTMAATLVRVAVGRTAWSGEQQVSSVERRKKSPDLTFGGIIPLYQF